MAEDMLKYPRGRIALLTGDLFDVTDLKVTTSVTTRVVATVVSPDGAGTVRAGPTTTTVTFNALVSENGPEHDYFKDLKAGVVRNIRIKIPGETVDVKGMTSQRSLEIPLGDAVKYSIEFIGIAESDFTAERKRRGGF